MAAGRSEIEYLKYSFYKDMYRGDRPDGGASQASTSAPNSRPTSARQRETPRGSSRPATPAWSSAPSHPDDPPWPRPPLFSAPASRPLGRPASASSRAERPRLRSEASSDVAAITAGGAGEANGLPSASSNVGPHVTAEAAPASARRARPASAPVGGRPKSSATPRAKWQEQHLHYNCANRPPAYGSIYADRGPYPGPGTYYSPEDATKALMKGHSFSHSARPTEEHFIKEDVGPSRPAGDPRLMYRPVPKFRGGTARDKPANGVSFSRSRRM